MIKYLVILACTVLPRYSFAQLSIDDAKKFLTNGSYRDWIFKNYKTDLGTSSCTGDGQLFEFLNNGKLIWKKCKNGNSIDTTLSWSIAPIANSVGEYMIAFSSPIQLSPNGAWVHSLQLFFDMPKIKTKNTFLTLKTSRNTKQQVIQTYKLMSIN